MRRGTFLPSRRSFVCAAVGLPPLVLAGEAWSQASDEMTVGSASAPLHIIEYASLTCPHCAQFHAQNWETLRTRYIETGRVRFTLREMATQPASVAGGMFQLARCENAAPEEYLRRVKILFERQAAILGTGTMGGVRNALVATGAEWGLSEAQVMACLTDPAGAARVRRSSEQAAQLGVNHTPSFLFNGVLDEDHDFLTPEGMVRILEARLARR